ncbi:hypothetical protein K493DRAFT_330389 [Basidiobolus meristosporus CBS 931.73]|uniref:P/Homo B domain-containing protein n=1 Tax=Basidiobolus meristosporus CBS 931.73 TaxID=1314790 RepID=A0A1Y1Y2Y4_9FUNG|nr:hypothetical protein K493DRAFT_330389 [Basidiobolus meristosporus CBS 931.73]|eukprot:ORX92377.1 hypothetical protein K493DRAFT_330389 [Basidiobolus meristosporus CBS 931.73]
MCRCSQVVILGLVLLSMWSSPNKLYSLILIFGLGECTLPIWYSARNHFTHQHYAIRINNAISPPEVSALLGLRHVGVINGLPDYHLFAAAKEDFMVHDRIEGFLDSPTPFSSLHKRGIPSLEHIDHIHKEELRQRVKREPTPSHQMRPNISTRQASILNLVDPGFRRQWHLNNQEDVGNDLNVLKVWESGIVGKDVVVALLDDGLDMDSEDLTHNYFSEGSYDFNDHSLVPNPKQPDDYHGTRCAGEIAAANNSVCGVGVAFGSKVSGIRILSGAISDVDEALALVHENQKNHIYSCSWGPPDDGRSMEGPSQVILDAMISGITKGRGGKGSIFVFATGNGGEFEDNCNFDGYANSIYTISIGAIDRFDQRPAYSEKCSAQLAVTYSSNTNGDGIYTTDVGKDACTNAHGGTSAAAPLAAGVFALVLSIRPDLHWRDIQHLAVRTAQPFALDDPDWQPTTAGHQFNHKFGYGKLDAFRMVEAAKEYHSVGPQVQYNSGVMEVNQQIPSSSAGLKHAFIVSPKIAQTHFLNLLEHVTVTINMVHQRRGDVEVYLISPNNVTSVLSPGREYDDSEEGFRGWTFMTVKHWDEPVVGEWSLLVMDQKNPEKVGTLQSWSLTFFGAKSEPVTPSPGEKPTNNASSTISSTITSPTSLRANPESAKAYLKLQDNDRGTETGPAADQLLDALEAESYHADSDESEITEITDMPNISAWLPKNMPFSRQ